MDIPFYLLLTLVCLVVVLAMWVCAASDTNKWGPDLTLELPPYLLQEAFLYHSRKAAPQRKIKRPAPSAPSECLSDPLLNNEHPVDISNPPPRMNMDSAVQVLPPHFPSRHNLRPVHCTFNMGESV